MKRKSTLLILLFALLVGLLGAFPAQAAEIPDVTQYSYTVTPILSPFAYYLYVQTDNPDPTSFRLVDKKSRFYGEDDWGSIYVVIGEGYSSSKVDPGTYYISSYIYPDVVYEDEDTYRVAGGYIFRADGAYSDGGELALLQKTYSGKYLTFDSFEDTDVIIPCQELHTRVSYLIDAYTTDEMSFFEKLDAVQERLNEISVYPRRVYDSNDPNEYRPYPCLAASPYPELWLNEHYEMFDWLDGGMLAAGVYPFVLDSLGVPGTMSSVAKELEPDCEIAAAGSHAWTHITFGGETRSYGGSGAGGNDPLFSEDVKKVFTFQGESDFWSNGTLESYHDLLSGYRDVAAEAIKEYRDMISGDTFKGKIRETGGTWIRIAKEGSGDASYAYLVSKGDGYILVSDAWVDGRYVSKWETISLNKKFEDYPTAGIVLPGVTYTDRYGETYTQEVAYTYSAEQDVWVAYGYYSEWLTSLEELPDELILTREEVERLDLDSNSSHWPESGLIYDGTVYPGTPFSMILVTGMSIPESLELGVGMETTLVAQVEPAEASDLTVTWSSSDDTVVKFPYYELGVIRGVGEGTAVLTAVTVDGGFTAQCLVTVVDYCKNGHSFTSYVSNDNATCTKDGTKSAKCDYCEATNTIADEGSVLGHEMGSWYSVTPPNCIQNGVEERECSRCGGCEKRLVAATGHTPWQWKVVIAATCTTDGSQQRDCANCDLYQKEVIAATGHKYVSTVVDPTCTEKGYTLHTCTCGESYTDTGTDALGHKWDAGVVTKEATEKETGSLTYTCGICGEVKAEVIPILEHRHSYTSEVTVPTCTEAGYSTYTCTCGDSYVSDHVEAFGHSEVVDEAVAATCEQSGLTEGSRCNRCETTFAAQEVIPATGHKFANDEDSTCDVCGYEREIETAILLGDVDDSGNVNFFDGMYVLQYYAGVIDETQLTVSAADVDSNGDVNFFDGMYILQYYAGIIEILPVEG